MFTGYSPGSYFLNRDGNTNKKTPTVLSGFCGVGRDWTLPLNHSKINLLYIQKHPVSPNCNWYQI